jgi:hypothetical protein
VYLAEIPIALGAVACALVLARIYRVSGTARLWLVAIASAGAVALAVSAWPRVILEKHGPGLEYGLVTIQWPLVPLAIATLIPIGARLPGGTVVQSFPALVAACVLALGVRYIT